MRNTNRDIEETNDRSQNAKQSEGKRTPRRRSFKDSVSLPSSGLFLISCVLMMMLFVSGGSALPQVQTHIIPLHSIDGLKLVNVKAEPETFKGRKAIRVTDAAPRGTGDEGRLAILSQTDFQDGTIEIDLAGEPGVGAGEGARGFVGLAFRVAADESRFE